MADSNTIKQQRDRFLAFSFASADLLLEVQETGKITFALGAAKGLTGIDHENMLNKDWLTLFAESEQAALTELSKTLTPALRRGPMIVTLDAKITKRKAILTAITMPESTNFYIALSFHNDLLDKLAKLIDADTQKEPAKDPKKNPPPPQKKENKDPAITTDFDPTKDEEKSVTTNFDPTANNDQNATTTGFDPNAGKADNTAMTTGFTAIDDENYDFGGTLYNKQEFSARADETFEIAREKELEAALTIFDLDKSETITEENWAEIIKGISEYLQENSIDGKGVGEINETTFSLLHDAKIKTQQMQEDVAALSKKIDPDGEGVALCAKTISADLEKLSNEEAARAVFYAISEFEKTGPDKDFEIESLDTGFETHVSNNEAKIKEFKSIIDRVDFDVYFQPIVDLKTKEAGYYEALSRFRSGDTQEWVMFGEDVGLSMQYDLAVVERTMNFIHYKAGMTRTKFSVNISGKSLQDPDFLEQLQEQLALRDLSNRMMFEITQSTRIKDLDTAANFVHTLQNAGYVIALDDFGAGAASLQFLKKLNPNFVKIDGQYIRRILKSDRDEIMVRGLTKMCKEYKTKLIAEFVEEQEQVDLLTEMGVQYGQGYLFGKAESKPSYVPPGE